jgi:hypothetical protein
MSLAILFLFLCAQHVSDINIHYKNWNKIASDIKLVFHSLTITMMHGPINIRNNNIFPMQDRKAHGNV